LPCRAPPPPLIALMKIHGRPVVGSMPVGVLTWTLQDAPTDYSG
jgi:hypothetical protein